MTRLPAPPSPQRRRLLAAAAGLVPFGCAAPQFVAPPPGPVATPQVRLGQRWRYETIDLYRGAKVGELHAEVVRAGPPSQPGSIGDTPAGAPIVVALTDASGAAVGEERWARPWDVIVESAYDAVQTFTRPMPLLPERLEAGARRSDATWYRVPQASGRMSWRQWLHAAGWERVAVPAGEFVALRVERLIQFDHQDSWRQWPQRFDTIWYAPGVHRWVQREWTGEYRWPGGRRPVVAYEDRVRWRLIDWRHDRGPAV
ncbi:MAG: hypothetical protein LC136_08285 [Burkholderiales bacterium]|nr:hypothetical protein [Burkholderiales bacterium]